MKKNLTEIVFILDKSGSMHGFEGDTVGGFNAMIEKQRAEEGEAFVTTVLFNTHSEIIHDRVPLAEVAPLAPSDFRVGGCTALYDTVGKTVRHIESIHKYARKEDVPENTVFVICTDGLENASREFGKGTVRKMIEEKKAKKGWEFVFLAANIDAEGEAEDIGIGRENAGAYLQTSDGIEACYAMMCESVSRVRRRKNENHQ